MGYWEQIAAVLLGWLLGCGVVVSWWTLADWFDRRHVLGSRCPNV